MELVSPAQIIHGEPVKHQLKNVNQIYALLTSNCRLTGAVTLVLHIQEQTQTGRPVHLNHAVANSFWL